MVKGADLLMNVLLSELFVNGCLIILIITNVFIQILWYDRLKCNCTTVHFFSSIIYKLLSNLNIYLVALVNDW